MVGGTEEAELQATLMIPRGKALDCINLMYICNQLSYQ